MFEFKLQIGCLIILLYFIGNYIYSTIRFKVKCNPFFDIMLYVAPQAIIFDGITAWTVNHMDIVPKWINLVCHGIFFVLMNILTIAVFLYIIQLTIGITNRRKLLSLSIPGIVSLICILIFLKDVVFTEGEKVNYSMGISVYICFASLFVHYLAILAVIIARYRAIEKQKLPGVVLFMLMSIIVLVTQIFLPEILMTSLVPTFMIMILYISFEDPLLHRLKIYNQDMVAGFATLVETRDNNTGGHINRTRVYVSIMLDKMKNMQKFKPVMSKDYITDVINAAPMHDLGKIAIPDYILQKPGKLTDDEYEIMKTHSKIGSQIIQDTFADMNDPAYQQIACDVAHYHHEKWNGKGYPEGLSGEEIPLHARIMAIADVFDAVSAKRCYRDPMPLERCFEIISGGSGSDFDPDLVAVFFSVKNEVTAYYNESRIKDSDLQPDNAVLTLL